MKRLIVIVLVALVAGGVSFAQTQAEEKVWKYEDDLKALLKSPKEEADYFGQLVDVHNQLGYWTKRVGYESKDKKDYWLGYAFVSYDQAARYSQKLVDQFKIKYYNSVKTKACGNAGQVYRALGEPKYIYHKSKKYEDHCGFLDKEDESLKDDPSDSKEEGGELSEGEYIDEEFEKTLVGKRLYFKTPKQAFSMMVYEPFVITDEWATSRAMIMKQYLKIANLPEAEGKIDKTKLKSDLSRVHWYSFDKDMGAVAFQAEEYGETEPKLSCESEEKDKSGIRRWTSVGSARACMSSVYKNPATGERIDGGVTLIEFRHKNDIFKFMLLGGKQKNTARNERILRAMANSLRMEGVVDLPVVTIRKCKDKSVQSLSKGIPVSWTIFDRSRKSVMIQQPVLARDYEVANVAAQYSGAVARLIDFTKGVKDMIEIPSDVLIEEDYWAAVSKMGGWQQNGAHIVEMKPITIDDYSAFELDGSLTSAVSAYFKALSSLASGAGKAGKKINDMSMRLFWEIPTITITAECVPQMICNNGEWRPDYQNMVYVEKERVKGVLRSPNKDFMTVRQVREDLDRYYYAELDRLEDNEAAYAKVRDRCDQCRQELRNIDFPLNFDKCPEIENKIQVKQYNILLTKEIKKVRKEEMRLWLSVYKPAELARLSARLTQLNLDIVNGEKELDRLRRLLLNQEANGQTSQAAETRDKIKFLEEDVALLRGFVTKTNSEKSEINSGKKETAMSKELSSISNQLSQLVKEKAALKIQLEKCVKEAEKVR